MDSWELHFREKSRRRFLGHRRERWMKAAVLVMLFGGIAAALLMEVAGYPG